MNASMLGLAQVLLAIAATTLTVATASAEGSDFYRRGCVWATQELSEAENDYQHAASLVANNAAYCPGGWNTNAACMQTIADNYQRALTRLHRAQDLYNRECR